MSHNRVYYLYHHWLPGSWLIVVGSPGLSSSRALLLQGRGVGRRMCRHRHTTVFRSRQVGGGLVYCRVSVLRSLASRLSWSLIWSRWISSSLAFSLSSSVLDLLILVLLAACMNNNPLVLNYRVPFSLCMFRFVHQFLVVIVVLPPPPHCRLTRLAHISSHPHPVVTHPLHALITAQSSRVPPYH